MENDEESTNNFCPFIKGDCKNDICVMWKENSCLIVNYLLSLQDGDSIDSNLIDTKFDDIEDYKKIPEKIELESVDNLANELVSYLKSNISQNQRIWVINHAKTFWENMGIFSWAMPPHIKTKMVQVESRAQGILDTQRGMKEKN